MPVAVFVTAIESPSRFFVFRHAKHKELRDLIAKESARAVAAQQPPLAEGQAAADLVGRVFLIKVSEETDLCCRAKVMGVEEGAEV